jgi:hypothetical protein
MEDTVSDTDDAEPLLAGQVDPVRPWTIRAVSVEARDLAIGAARKDGVSVGQWLERHIRAWAGSDSPAPSSGTAVATAVAPARGKPEAPLAASDTLSEVERISAAVRDLAAAGLPISKATVAKVTRALVKQLPP